MWKFEIFKKRNGKFTFRLRAHNGQILAVGDDYSSKGRCVDTIALVKKYTPIAPVVEVDL